MLSRFFNEVFLTLSLDFSNLRFGFLNLVEGKSIFCWVLDTLFEVSCTILVEFHEEFMDSIPELFEG
jgi:hypothetical protein